MYSKHLIIYAILLSLFVSCKKDKVDTAETDNLFKFRDYISYTTAGRVSIADPIIVNLTNDVEGWEMGKEIKDAILSISPNVKGKLTIANAHALSFQPDENLKPNTEYTVKVKLNKIYKNQPKGYEEYTFQFKTIEPNFNVITNNLQSYSKEWQYLEAVLKSADVISLKDAKQLVEAWQDGKKLKLQWTMQQRIPRYLSLK